MRTIFKYKKTIITAILIVTIFFALQIPDIEINNDIQVFLPENHISKINNDKVEDIFGGNERIIIALEAKNGIIFTKEYISLIDKLTNEFEDIQGVDEVISLTNSDYIEGTEEGMVVEELIKEIPENSEDIAYIKEKLLSWDLYRDNLYTDDFKATQISLALKDELSTEEREAAYFQVEEITDNLKNDNLSLYISGPSAINVLMGEKMQEDIKRLIPFVVIAIFLVLYLFFKRILPVFLTMLTVIISSIWAIGLMALMGINLTLVSTVIPVLLIAVGSAYGIHILTHYYHYLLEEKTEIEEEKHQEIVLKTVNQMGKTVLLAGLTTVAGFGSLASSDIIPIRDFGIFTAIGIITAFMVALILIPALLLIGFKKKNYSSKNKLKNISFMEKIIAGLHNLSTQKAASILLFSLIVIVVSIFGINKIIVDSTMIDMFKEDTEIKKANEFINNNFAGTAIMNIMVEGEEKGSLTEAEILKAMEDLGDHLSENFTEVGKVSSISNFIKRMNRVMHYPASEDNTFEDTSEESGGFSSFYSSDDEQSLDEQFAEKSDTERDIITGPDTEKNMSEYELILLLNQALGTAEKLDLSAEELIELINRELNFRGAAYNEIPYDLSKYPATDKKGLQELISQYLLLYSGSLDDLINDQLEPDKARMMVQLNTSSNIASARVKDEIIKFCQTHFPEGYNFIVAGYSILSLAANQLIVKSQIMSILLSFIIVFAIMAINYKSLIAGLYGIIPLSFSLLINFALMGYTGITLNVGTAMVASIAIGIGVDYTIHFLDGYHKERKKSNDLEQVTKSTLRTTGKAIIFNALSVAAGFMVLIFSNFYPLNYLGILIAITMLTSSLTALTILPLLLNVFKPAFISK